MQVRVKPISARAVFVMRITETLSSFTALYLKAARRTAVLPIVEIRAETIFQVVRNPFSVGEMRGVSIFNCLSAYTR